MFLACLPSSAPGLPTIPVARWLTSNGKGKGDLNTHQVRVHDMLRGLGL